MPFARCQMPDARCQMPPFGIYRTTENTRKLLMGVGCIWKSPPEEASGRAGSTALEARRNTYRLAFIPPSL